MLKKMKAIAAVAATLALSAALMTGCSGGSDSSADSSADQPATNDAASSDTTLVVGFDSGYPPYGYVGDDGNYTGFDLDLATAVAEKKGWEVQLEPIDWDAKDALIDSGAIDCIWNGFTMEGREGDYAFSEPYMLNEQVLVVRSDSGIETTADLADKIVMTQVDSAALDVLEGDQADLAATFKEVQTIGDYNNAFMQLESGMVDAVACDLSIAAYQMAANPDAYKELDTLSSEHYAVGFAKDNQAQADEVTAALKELDAEGTVAELCEKYADQGISYDNWVLGK